MDQHPGHHGRRISLSLTSFCSGMLRTKCFRHQFQILQIWRARITEAFATITEDMLENTWREIDYRLDVLRKTKGAHVEMYWCAVKKPWFELHFLKKVFIPHSLLVINVCKQGEILCSLCISFIYKYMCVCVYVFNMENIQRFIRVNNSQNMIKQLYFQTIPEREVSDTVWIWWELMLALWCNLSSDSVWWQHHYLMICL